MTDFGEIDRLLDKSLNSEISVQETLRLETLCSQTDENLNYYLQLIDEQVTLKNALTVLPPIGDEKYTDSKISKFPFWLLFCLIITLPIFYLAFQKVTALPPERLTISPRSQEVSLIRQQQEVQHPSQLRLITGDHIKVGDEGELWLTTKQNDSIYISPGSVIKINHHSQESLTLIKGSMSAVITENGSPFILTTTDSELRIIGGKVKVLVAETTVAETHEGTGEITRLKDGQKRKLIAGEKIQSGDFQTFPIKQQEVSQFLPSLLNGIRYSYHELSSSNTPGRFKTSREIDQGITNLFKIKRGEHEGYTRYQHDKHSHIHTSDFHITFRSLLKVNEAGNYSFKLSGSAPSTFTISNKSISIGKYSKEVSLNVQLNPGLHSITAQSIGIIEDDTPGYSMRIRMKSYTGSYEDIPAEKLYYSERYPLPNIFQNQNVDKKLSAHLPLKGSFKDQVNKEDAAPIGNPQFTLDPKYGPVLKLDGKDDSLVHYPVDKLGMNISYTATLWLNMEEQDHYDQVIFSNQQDAGGISSNLVILIRRMYPYLAHLSNDTIADEKLKYNEWSHLAFRYHEGRQSIFLNGKLAVSSFNHTILSSHNSLIIGRWNSSRHLKGKVRDIRIYNAPLSANDINTLYNQTK